VSTLDPFGHLITEKYGDWLEKGWDIRPTIAVTKAHIDLPECREAIAKGRLKPDGKILLPSGQSGTYVRSDLNESICREMRN